MELKGKKLYLVMAAVLMFGFMGGAFCCGGSGGQSSADGGKVGVSNGGCKLPLKPHDMCAGAFCWIVCY